MSRKPKTSVNSGNHMSTTTPTETLTIPVSQIDRGPNPGRYRETPSTETVAALAASIKAVGQLAPVLVQRVEGTDRFRLIAGFTRTAACELLGIDVRAEVVAPASAIDALNASIDENMKRADLTLIDVATIMQRLKTAGLSGNQVAKRLECTPAWVSKCSRLLKLPKVIQDAIADKKLTGQAGQALCELDTEDAQLALFADSVKLVPNPRVDKNIDGESIDADGTLLSDDALASSEPMIETYDSAKIIKHVANLRKKAEPKAESETESETEGETESKGAGEPKSSAKQKLEQAADIFRRALNNVPALSANAKAFCEGFVNFAAGNTTAEHFERDVANAFGFAVSDLYLDEEKQGE